MDEVSRELHSLMGIEDELRDCTVLVLCNKQDLPHAESVQTISDKIHMERVKQKWYIQPTSALYNEGIFDGLEWLYNNIDNE